MAEKKFHDCSVIMRLLLVSGAVHEAAGKNEHREKGRKITVEGEERVPERPEGAVKPEFHTVA